MKGANIYRLQEAVLEKDDNGEWCFYFSRHVPDADVPLLEAEIRKRDKKGDYRYFIDTGGASIIIGRN